MPTSPAQRALDAERFQIYAAGTRHFFDEFEKFTAIAALHGHPEAIDAQHIQLVRNVLIKHHGKWTTYRDELLQMADRMAEIESEAVTEILSPQSPALTASHQPAPCEPAEMPPQPRDTQAIRNLTVFVLIFIIGLTLGMLIGA